MTISEVCEKYDITAGTLRYYEKAGVIPAVPRDSSGVRNFDEDSLGWVELAICMRKAGMSIEALSKYVGLYGDEGSKAERREILVNQKKELEKEIEDLQKAKDLLEYKICLYDAGKIQ